MYYIAIGYFRFCCLQITLGLSVQKNNLVYHQVETGKAPQLSAVLVARLAASRYNDVWGIQLFLSYYLLRLTAIIQLMTVECSRVFNTTF